MPDPALGVIEHASGIKGLLASALVSIVCVIPHEHFEFIVTGLHIFCHVEAEGQVSVSMASNFPAIPVNSAALVHCAEVQNEPPALRKMKIFNSSSVPESLPGLQNAVYSRARRLGGKGHQNQPVG